MRIIKYIFLLFLSMPISLISCSDVSNKSSGYANSLLYDDVDFMLVNDNLKHTQYWQNNDFWDMSSVTISVHLKDGDIIEIPFINDNMSYDCDPISPEGLPISTEDNPTTSFEIYNISYSFDSNNHIDIPSHKFSNITIVPYPYKEIHIKKPFVIISLVISTTLVIVLSVVVIRKKKHDHQQN